MKRRDFISAIPGAAALVGPIVRGPEGRVVSILTPDAPHPRLEVAVRDLADLLRRLRYSVSHRDTTDAAAVIRLEQTASLPPEHFQLDAKAGAVDLRGGDSRALVYALSELRRRIELAGQLPTSLSLRRQPHFSVRRWSTGVSHRIGSPWDDRIHLSQRFAYIKSELFARAADYGISSVELNGRPGDGWDIDWMIGFESFPELAGLFPKGERRQRLALVEDLARSAHDNLLELLVWNHELHLPTGFTEVYPQVKGTAYPVCLSNDFLKKFIRHKYVEFFKGAPSVDGVVISVNESGQFSLITDTGCQCDRCRGMSQHDRLMAVVNEVIEAVGKLKKQVVVRTFQASHIHDLDSHPELETIRKAYVGIPAHVPIMSKYCPLDFYGGGIADEPLIGAFPNSHLVEFSLDVEWQGRTFIPVLTPDNFRRRIAHAVGKKCAGVVARVDFPWPTMEPSPIFGHPNEFNAWWMAELLWQPTAAIDDSLLRWTTLRYGSAAAPLVASALRKTEAITQETFFAFGQTLVNYQNMIASVSNCDNSLWSHALSKWDPSKRALSKSFFEPDADFIERCRKEKEHAMALAEEGLREIHKARLSLAVLDYQRLRYDFEKLRDTAELWKHLTQLYLLHRQISSSPAQPDRVKSALAARDARLTRLFQAARSVIATAHRIEHLHGNDCWPVVSPDRGVTAYQFAQDVLRHYIAGHTGEATRDTVKTRVFDSVVTTPVVELDSTESLWRDLVECGRPGFEIGNAKQAAFKWPVGLDRIRLEHGDMILARGKDSLRLPLGYPVAPVSLDRNTGALAIRKSIGRLVVSLR